MKDKAGVEVDVAGPVFAVEPVLVVVSVNLEHPGAMTSIKINVEAMIENICFRILFKL